MKSFLIFVALSFGFGHYPYSQQNPTPFPKNTAYAELLGSGFILTFNYQQYFLLEANRHLSLRAGIGPGFDKEDALLPIGLTYNLGNLKPFFETG
jgi:hypothetical protein